MHTVDDLLDFYRRAHNSLDGLFHHASRISWDKLIQPLPGFGQDSLRSTLLHIADTEDYWLSRLRGAAFESWDYGAYTSMEQVRDALRQVRDRTHRYLGGLSDAQLNERVELDFGADSVFLTPALVLLHVITHAFHHKGQAVAMCRLHGLPAPDTDLDLS